ncbi:hypothetical protein PT2222_80196 [Paraburkholderia tropica]
MARVRRANDMRCNRSRREGAFCAVSPSLGAVRKGQATPVRASVLHSRLARRAQAQMQTDARKKSRSEERLFHQRTIHEGSASLVFELRKVAHGALVGGHHELGVGLERGRHLARTRQHRLPALRVLLFAAAREFLVGHQHVDRAVRNVDADLVAVAHEADRAARCRFRRAVADREARGAAREAAVGQQRAGLAQTLRLDVAGRVEHFLHAGAALRAFVAHDHHVAGLDLVGEDVRDRFVLRFGHVRRAFEHEDAVVHARRLHHAAVERDVAGQHGEAAFLRERVLVRADAAFGAVGVEARPARVLAERDLRGHARRTRHVERLHGCVVGAHDVPLVERVLERRRMHGRHVGVQLAGAVEFAEDRHDAARAMHVFDVVLVRVRRNLAELRHDAREAVDVAHRELDARFLRDRQQVQDRVGRAAHGDVERHGVLEGLEAHRARQHAFVFLFVVLARQFDDAMTRALEELFAVRVRGHHRAVARQREAQRFGQAVHRVGREHARARTAGRARRALDFGHFGVAVLGVGGDHHRVDQVQLLDFDGLRDRVREARLARFHRAARHEDHGDVQAHGGHQHARGDLVAVRDADHGVGAVRVDHVLDRVGDDVAARQRIEHAVVAHRDAVVDRDGVEFLGDAAGGLDLARDELAQILQVHVAGHELGERVDHRDDRLLEVFVFHAGGAPQGARPRHVAAGGGGFGTVCGHRGCYEKVEKVAGKQRATGIKALRAPVRTTF